MNFIQKIDSIDVKGGKLLNIYQYNIRWPLIKNNLDIAELLILYTMHNMETNIEKLKENKETKSIEQAEKIYFDFKRAMDPPGTPPFKGSSGNRKPPAPAPQDYERN